MSEHTHTFQCRSLLSNLSDYIDGDLPEELCAKIEEHMKTCENCKVVINTLKKTVELYEISSDNAELPGGVKERLYARLNLDDYLKRNSF